MRAADNRSESGFSLLELMIAMMVTLLVSGAVFGLITAGQGAFRREPELTERQQNIRAAMDLIQRDIATGGVGMEAFEQVFTRGDGVNETAPFLDGPATAPMGSQGQRTDYLQILGNDGNCPDVPIADVDGTNINTLLNFPACYPDPSMVMIVLDNGNTVWSWGHNIHSQDRKVNIPDGQQPPKSETSGSGQPFPPAGPRPLRVMPIQLIRYEVAADQDGVPGLWRSIQGGINEDGDYVPAPNPTGGWQMVARGIEDFQVEYTQADETVSTLAPRVTAGTFTSLVREVRVTLWARALAQNLQGLSNAPTGPQAVRGSLSSVTTPRAALMHLRTATPPLWN